MDYTELWGSVEKEKYEFVAEKGLNEDVVKAIHKFEEEPDEMLNDRLNALKSFNPNEIERWRPLPHIDFNDIRYYAKPKKGSHLTWDELPDSVKSAFESMKISKEEMDFLAGVVAQYDSMSIYERVKDVWEKKGIIFKPMPEAIKEHYDLIKPYLNKIEDRNPFVKLNKAVWSGGTFLYVPKGVKAPFPFQSFFRINLPGVGQFERSLIIIEDDAEAFYIEGCSAPIYSFDYLHAGLVDMFVGKNAKLKFATVQNWSKNVINVGVKRVEVYDNANIEVIEINLGSKITSAYPKVHVKGDNTSVKGLSLSYVTKGQVIDTGFNVKVKGKASNIHVESKSILSGGDSTTRIWANIDKTADKTDLFSSCDSLMLTNGNVKTYPKIFVKNSTSHASHEAKAGKIDESLIAYLTSRGMSESEAISFAIMGYVGSTIEELPMDYVVDIKRYISTEKGWSG